MFFTGWVTFRTSIQRQDPTPPYLLSQIKDFNFDSSAVEVVGLAFLRWIILGAVLLRSRACLVRVKADGTIKPSVDAIVALTTCAVSAGYCVFKACYIRCCCCTW